MPQTRRYGWVKDRDNPNHPKFAIPASRDVGAPRPSKVDLRSLCPPVYDQLELGSCTGNALAGALEFDSIKQGRPIATPSRLFIYYNERLIEGTVTEDAGAQIFDGITVVAKTGVCPETVWPYDPSQFAVQPPVTCYTDALQFTALDYGQVNQDLDDLRDCLAAGFPFVFGFTAYAGLESQSAANTGVVPMPSWLQRPIGGHAVMAVSYDDSTGMFGFRNSWGEEWGQGGYGELHYEYLDSNLASDFWVIRTVS